MNALKRLFGLRVLATLDDGDAIDGTLESGADGWIVFTHATLIPPSGEHFAMDGTQFVAVSRVTRLQVP